MATKISVTKTFDGNEWLLFEETEVRKACCLANCSPEIIEGCIANMKEGSEECTDCYVNLMNEVKAEPTYCGVNESTSLAGGKTYLVHPVPIANPPKESIVS